MSKITTPVPLSALRMTISFRCDSSLTIFLCLYDNFIFAYFSQVLSSFALVCCNFVSGILEMFLKQLKLTYHVEQGLRLIKPLEESLTRLLLETIQLEFGFTGSKLSTHFQIKTKQYLNIIMMLFT